MVKHRRTQPVKTPLKTGRVPRFESDHFLARVIFRAQMTDNSKQGQGYSTCIPRTIALSCLILYHRGCYYSTKRRRTLHRTLFRTFPPPLLCPLLDFRRYYQQILQCHLQCPLV